ncbi:uncharacterized protein LOC115977770 [Quercus lobata]|uniref:DNL-type domain-containing protein n=1 Tax=Quercus lobata TaxID=97700 RepID=A0A7N2KSW4_QUELO|nr:uncharacterized protein LOC115977770 [Quercus lobata]
MEALGSSANLSSSSSPSSIFSPKRTDSPRLVRFPFPFPISSKKEGNDSDLQSDSKAKDSSLVPLFHNHTLSKDAAMGLVLSAASVRGWTTGSGMEGPSVPAGAAESESGTERISTFPWSLFTKSPRRRMRVAFTCNVCGQRTTRAINPHAYTDGTVFVQCCGCNVFHKLVDNLNLFHEMKCYVNPDFNYRDSNGDLGFNYLDIDDDDHHHRNDAFPI